MHTICDDKFDIQIGKRKRKQCVSLISKLF